MDDEDAVLSNRVFKVLINCIARYTETARNQTDIAIRFSPGLFDHDQNEAMTFAHNIIVMDEGSIVQVGTPQELFERPQTSFVGYFIGAPAMNMYEGTISSKNDVTVHGHKFKTKTDLGKIKTDNVKLGIRAEFITLAAKKSAGAIKADVTRMEDFGNYRLVTAQVGEMVVKAKIKREASLSADKVWMTFPAERCCVYADEVLV